MANLSKELIASSTPLKTATHTSGWFLKDRPIGSASPYIIPTIYGINDRSNNEQATWSSGDFWTTYNVYMSQAADAERSCFVALGAYNYSAGPEMTYGPAKDPYGHRIEFAKGNRVGIANVGHQVPNNNTSYGPFGSRIMFVKNRGASAVSVTFYGSTSSYWSSGNDGSGMYIGEPNTSGYSGVTSLSWTRLAVYQSSTNQQNFSGSYTLQPGRSYVIVLTNTFIYWTTFPSGGHWSQGNQFYNLSTTFANSNIVPDLKLTHTAEVGGGTNRFSNAASNQFFNFWPLCGELFGENSEAEVIW